MMRQLLAAELGDVLREAAGVHGARGWLGALLTEDSPLRSLEDGPVDAVGVEALDHVEMDRLRSTCRAPRRSSGTRRRRWFSWRRKPAATSTGGTADIALPAS